MIYVARYALIVLYTLFWSGPACLVGPFDREGRAICWIGRQYMSWILRACRIRVEAEGVENIDRLQPYVFMTNHQSVVDIAAIVVSIPVPWRFVAKRELTWIPVFGWALALGRQVIIDRGNRERAVRSLRHAASRIRSGTNVIIFPEGTRSETGELRAFKSGGFHLAIQAQVPILPATVSGSRRITPKGSLRVESGVVKVTYGKPIPTLGLDIEERETLKLRVREAIQAGFDPGLQLDESAAAADRRQGRESSPA